MSGSGQRCQAGAAPASHYNAAPPRVVRRLRFWLAALFLFMWGQVCPNVKLLRYESRNAFLGALRRKPTVQNDRRRRRAAAAREDDADDDGAPALLVVDPLPGTAPCG